MRCGRDENLITSTRARTLSLIAIELIAREGRGGVFVNRLFSKSRGSLVRSTSSALHFTRHLDSEIFVSPINALLFRIALSHIAIL